MSAQPPKHWRRWMRYSLTCGDGTWTMLYYLLLGSMVLTALVITNGQ